MSEKTFEFFPFFPEELRTLVWKECLPCRIVELDVPAACIHQTYCNMQAVSRWNARVPIISHVCRESRQIVQREGRFLLDYIREVYEDPDREAWSSPNDLSDQWICLKTDVIQLHFNDNYDDLQWPQWGRTHAAEHLRKCSVTARGASITADVLRPFNEPCNDIWRFGNNQFLKRLDGRAEYQVCLKTINIHLSPQQALKTQLFGLLGEEIVKCVDAHDAETIAKYHALCLQGDSNDTQARGDFAFITSPEFSALMDDWKVQAQKVWIFYKWRLAVGKMTMGKDDYTDPVSYPQDLLAHYKQTGIVWTLNSQSGLGYAQIRSPENYDLTSDNPWTQEVIKSQTFRPVIMFRLCQGECWRNSVPASPQSGGPPWAGGLHENSFSF